MNFSSLVLMEKDKESNYFVRELGSYEVPEGAENITKFYYDGENINLYFDTNKDVEEWEYSAIFDLFNEEGFEREELSIEQIDEEYNPTWLLKFNYMEEHEAMEEKLQRICNLIEQEMHSVFKAIEGKEEEYK